MSVGAPAITAFHDAATGTCSYIVSDPATRRAAIIDPVLDFDAKSGRTATRSADALLAALRARGDTLEWICETHAHADHLTAAAYLRAQAGGRIAIGAGIRHVLCEFAPLFGFGPECPVDGSQFDHLFADGECFAIGTLEARVIAVPGHTIDSLAYLVGDAAFIGDTLFLPQAGTARTDFPGGDAGRLYDSIGLLYALPEATRLFMCHVYPQPGEAPQFATTVGEQRSSNIHLRAGTSREEFVALRTARDRELALPALIIPALQVNIRAGALPAPQANGIAYLRIPLDVFGTP
ncbi:MAG TPA: MBL fold metallo-hydrolase [Steroidobacteraceae bacterium]|nr:MBL fold metallo-hydrolase [Steroidobacteraceae bacterium]HNS26731.1 MBL fold metallo-hydrolase [Steroidobacteraceae bacterium]